MLVWNQGSHRPETPQWKRGQQITLANGVRIISRIRLIHPDAATVVLTDPTGSYPDTEIWDRQLVQLLLDS